MPFALIDKAANATPLVVLTQGQFAPWLSAQGAYVRNWFSAAKFTCASGEHALVPGADGRLAMAVAGAGDALGLWSIGQLAHALPVRTYALSGKYSAADATQLALGWALGAYRFERYKTKKVEPARLVLPKAADRAYVLAMAEATCFARDLINTPAADMLPTQLSGVCTALAKQHKAKATVLAGEQLLSANYPSIYTVGKGSADAPRLVDIRHGKLGAPKVTLVGKGVCFDSGGLDIKTAAGMQLMKKDMGGLAIMLALAKLIMQSGLNVQLRVLCPMVENAVSGSAMRPLDIIKTRKGLTVEVGDTDAEGRLILCDALAEADSEKPDLIIDCATLTGAARVALGPDMPAFFTPDDTLAAQLAKHSAGEQDPLYRLPLYAPYREMLSSKTADMSNITESSYAGSITAALFLKEFVEHTSAWLHIDAMAWNPTARPGRPAGGEAQGLRALYALVQERYGKA